MSAQTPSNALQPHRRILELDSLRALAAINLVAFHLTHVYSVKFGYTTPLGFEWPYGAYGTEMFFILSGFVNSMSLLRRRRPVDFVAARMIRIIPIFLLAIVANLWILSWAPMNQQVSTGQFLANLTLMPMVLGYECLDPVMWTLQIEMMFYATLVILFKTGGLQRYFRGWGFLLLASIVICPTLDTLQVSHGDAGWFALATAIRRLMVLDYVPLFTMGFLIYMIKTDTGKRWQNLIGIVVAATVFHSIDHGKHNPAATALILGLVTLCAYGRFPLLRFKPLVFVSTISYALYLCHNNLACVLIHRFDHSGIPPLFCLMIAVVFSLAMAIIITNRIEQPITNALRNAWSRFRASKRGDTEVVTAS